MKIKKRLLAVFMMTAMLLTQMPLAFAEGSDPVTINLSGFNSSGSGYTMDGYTLNITGDGSYRLTGGITTRRVIVTAANPHITLSNVTIYGGAAGIPFSISSGSTVNLTLEGSNTLRFDDDINGAGAGLYVPAGAAVIIDGSGSLTATGKKDSNNSKSGAGIGGMDAKGNAGSITINGGTVTAIGGTYSAGIGGGNNYNGTDAGNGGTITINGGVVTATGGSHASGIGGACRGAGGTVAINGGTVAATGGSGSAGIGGGFTGDTGDIRITGGFVTATAAGIGSGIGRTPGGADGSSGDGSILISGGTVFAQGAGAGIPGLGSWSSYTDASGTYYDTTTLQITGGSVRSTPALIVPPDGADTTPIYLTTVSVTGTGVANKELYYKIDGSDPAGVRTDEAGKLYFWLTEGTHELAVIMDGQLYQTSLVVSALNGNPHTLAATPDGSFIPVSSIGWMGANGPEPIAGVPFDLSGTLEITPYNATYDSIVWSIEDAGSTGASVVGSVLTASSIGSLRIKATVKRFGIALNSWTASVAVKAASGTPAPGEQFSLTPGGTYYFDLSGQGIEGALAPLGSSTSPGSINSNLPDGSLHWVPFTYAGTVNAYSRTSAGVSTAGTVSATDRSLFVANYNVAQAAPWDNLNSAGLVFGKDYSSGGISYKLRSLSAGSGYTGTEHGNGEATRGVPANNEWDQILNKNTGFIKNWNELFSLGQDTDATSSILYGARGSYSARDYYAIYGSINHGSAGFRPALEITSAPATGLKTVTYSMNGKGALGSGGLTSATVVYTGALTLPEITAENGFTYTGTGSGSLGWYAGSTFYAPGTTPTLATGTILTLGYNPAPAVTTSTLPSGTKDVPYSASLTATGSAPISWSIDSGSLPNGMSLNTINGYITGTPTAAGTFSFTVKAKNSVGSVTKQLSITIASDPDIAIVDAAKSAAESASYSDMIQAAVTSESVIAAALKSAAETAVSNGNVTVTINQVSYNAPTAGTADAPSGTNGSYVFTIKVEKGSQSQTTAQKTIAITATPFTGLTNVQAVAAAKSVIVNGTVNVAFGATQVQKTAAVQNYVNNLLTGNAAGVTATVTYASGNQYDVALSKGSASDSKSITMTVNEVVVHTVTFNLNGGTRTGGGDLMQTVVDGGSATAPTVARDGYTLTGWDKAFSNVTANLTVTALWSQNSSGGMGGGTTAPKYEAEVTGAGSSIKAEVTLDAKTGSASAELSSGQIKNSKTFVVTMPKISGVTDYALKIPAPDLSETSGSRSITLGTASCSVTLPSNMLTGTQISGEKAQLTIGAVKASQLPEAARSAVGNHPIVSLSLAVDGKAVSWNNPNTPVTVSIPYTPTAEELQNPERITAYYIDGSGNLTRVSGARYDTKSGAVVFETTHFSYYAAGYVKVQFSDVLPGAWYYDAVSFIAEKGITTGTSATTFSPDATLTRGQFITMLMRACKIAPDENPSDNFSDAGSTYYTGYLAAAKHLGISNGVGNNSFAPEQAITRQEMFVMLYNALKVLDQMPKGDTGKKLSDFSDNAAVAGWATEALTALVKSGIVSGSGGKLNPTVTTTRAQMAQVLYNLMGK